MLNAEKTRNLMLLGITGGEENVKTAIDYLQQMPGVIAREVPVNV